MKNSVAALFNRKLSGVQHKDVGLLVVLVLLFFHMRYESRVLLIAALIAAAITLLLPVLLHPISKAWYALSDLLGAVMSRLVLSMVFFLIITPVGLIKRRADGRRLLSEKWKKDTVSVFTIENRTIAKQDVVNSF